MFTRKEIEIKLAQIKPILELRFHVSKIGFFGSYSNETQEPDSDLDLLVEFNQPVGWEFFTLEKFLEQSLGIQIDLVTQNALKEHMKESVLKQVQYI